MRKNIVGVDLGGTNIRAGKIVDNIITHVAKRQTPAKGTTNEVLDELFACIKECFDEETAGIGIGVPSVVDLQNGIVYNVVNIPSWEKVPLQNLISDEFKVPVFINNDSNCFVAGEKLFGKAQEFKNVVGMTIGTGLGLGLIINGRLYSGRNCCAGEFGMLPYLNATFESYCSGQFFNDSNFSSAKNTYEQAQKGDSEALALFADFGKHLGVAIKSILYSYDPEIIILGGSVAKAYPYYKDAMLKEIESFEFQNVLDNFKIDISDLTESAILGAAALVADNFTT